MPRTARIKNDPHGIYHIMERGNEQKDLFKDEEDYVHFLGILERNRKKYGFYLYAYCLMTNHLHLLLGSNGADISQVMKSINVSYVIYFNRKYTRCGHLFQDRFKSEYIDSDAYLLEVSRYIHLNPVRASMVSLSQLTDYPWSSAAAYWGKKSPVSLHVDIGFIPSILATKEQQAASSYTEFVLQTEAVMKRPSLSTDASEMPNPPHGKKKLLLPAQEVLESWAMVYGLKAKELLDKHTEHIDIRNEIIKEIRKSSQLSMKEIGQLFAISESAVSKILGG